MTTSGRRRADALNVACTPGTAGVDAVTTIPPSVVGRTNTAATPDASVTVNGTPSRASRRSPAPAVMRHSIAALGSGWFAASVTRTTNATGSVVSRNPDCPFPSTATIRASFGAVGARSLLHATTASGLTASAATIVSNLYDMT